MALDLPSTSTSTTPETTEEDDAVQVVFPDKRRVLSDMKAIVDYQETQIHMAHRKIIQAETQLAVEKNRVAELQAENEGLKKKLQEAEESVTTMQWQVEQERTERDTQIESLKNQNQTLQNSRREGQEQVHCLLNMAKGHVSDVRTFWKNFNDTGKHLIACFPGNEASPNSTFATTVLAAAPPTTLSFSSAGKSPTTSSSSNSNSTNSSENSNVEERGGEPPLTVLKLACPSPLDNSRPKKKRLKTKSTEWRIARIENHLKSLSTEFGTPRDRAVLEAYMKSVLGPALVPSSVSVPAPVDQPEQSSSSSSTAIASATTSKRTASDTSTENGDDAAKRSKN